MTATQQDDGAYRCFAVTLGALEAVVLGLFIAFTAYGESSRGDRGRHLPESGANVYSMFQDVHVMIFVGFGFLMTFLRRYGYSAVGLNFLLSAYALQWAILCRGFFAQAMQTSYRGGNAMSRTPVNLEELVNGDFAAGSVMIAFGAVIGKVSATELLLMAFCQVVFYAINEQMIIERLQIADAGGSLVIHTFGAFFGLAVSKVRCPRKLLADNRDVDCKSVYHSDLFAMIGTLFLWCFWPSFNGALVGDEANASQRAVVNTLLSLTGSTVATFLCSRVLREGGRFDMVDVQNATLAGGVAVGSIAHLALEPWGALIVGIGAGVASTLGFCYLQAWVLSRLGLHDTCGVLNLHGMPGVLSGFASAIVAGTVSDAKYGAGTDNAHVDVFYPARGPHGLLRTRSEQAAMQVAAVFVTLGMAIGSGLLVGALLRWLPCLAPPERLFEDAEEWGLPDPERAAENTPGKRYRRELTVPEGAATAPAV